MNHLNLLGGLDFEAVLGALINSQDSRNRIKMVEVTATTNPWFETSTKHVTKDELLRLLIELDSDGDPAIRVGFHSTTGSTKLPSAGLDEDQLIHSVIGKTSDGKPYLRVALDSL